MEKRKGKMRISRKNKFVFLLKLKCANEATRQNLNKYSEMYYK